MGSPVRLAPRASRVDSELEPRVRIGVTTISVDSRTRVLRSRSRPHQRDHGGQWSFGSVLEASYCRSLTRAAT